MYVNKYLSDNVVIVTGGASGIGQACVAALSRGGAHVVIADLFQEKAADVAATISAETGGQIWALGTDITDSDQCHELIQQAYDQMGRLDILINCAGGILKKKPVLELEIGIWHRTLDVNLHGAYYCSRAFAQQVVSQQGKGAIVSISSIYGTQTAPGIAPYSVSKAALSHLTRALALEWAKDNIRVNAVAPSHVNTAKIRQRAENGTLDLEAVIRRIPMGRIAEPAEIADVVLFLCSDQSRFVTGQTIFVDGGYTINGGV